MWFIGTEQCVLQQTAHALSHSFHGEHSNYSVGAPHSATGAEFLKAGADSANKSFLTQGEQSQSGFYYFNFVDAADVINLNDLDKERAPPSISKAGVAPHGVSSTRPSTRATLISHTLYNSRMRFAYKAGGFNRDSSSEAYATRSKGEFGRRKSSQSAYESAPQPRSRTVLGGPAKRHS